MNLNKIIYINNNSLIIKDNININEYKLNNILRKGIIINKELFKKELNKILKYNLIKTIINNNKIVVLYNDHISINDRNVIKLCIEELGIYKYKIISDFNLINIKENECILIQDSSFIRLYYIDKFSKIKKLIFDLDDYSIFEIKYLLLNRLKNKITYVINDDINFEKILKTINVKYYIYNDKYFLINSFVLK